MEISRRVVEQLRQMKRRIEQIESQLQSVTHNTSTGGGHYLVEAGEDGIPAFADPVPGMANCNIVRRYSSNTDEDKELATMTTKERIYNLGGQIPSGLVVMAHRDAYGDLFIPASSEAVLAQAPVGGIPARVGLVPGSAECKKVNIIDGDLVITDQEFAVLNWDLVVRGADDDRIILVSKHSDNALLIAPIGSGDSGVEPCGESGITIPDIETQPIVSAADLDYVIGLKDGCLVLVEVRNCPPSEEPSGEPSGEPSVEPSYPSFSDSAIGPSGEPSGSVLPSEPVISI